MQMQIKLFFTTYVVFVGVGGGGGGVFFVCLIRFNLKLSKWNSTEVIIREIYSCLHVPFQCSKLNAFAVNQPRFLSIAKIEWIVFFFTIMLETNAHVHCCYGN